MRFARIAAVMALASSTLAISASQVQANINKTSRLAIQANNDASELGGLDISMQLPVCLEKTISPLIPNPFGRRDKKKIGQIKLICFFFFF